MYQHVFSVSFAQLLPNMSSCQIFFRPKLPPLTVRMLTSLIALEQKLVPTLQRKTWRRTFLHASVGSLDSSFMIRDSWSFMHVLQILPRPIRGNCGCSRWPKLSWHPNETNEACRLHNQKHSKESTQLDGGCDWISPTQWVLHLRDILQRTDQTVQELCRYIQLSHVNSLHKVPVMQDLAFSTIINSHLPTIPTALCPVVQSMLLSASK